MNQVVLPYDIIWKIFKEQDNYPTLYNMMFLDKYFYYNYIHLSVVSQTHRIECLISLISKSIHQIILSDTTKLNDICVKDVIAVYNKYKNAYIQYFSKKGPFVKRVAPQLTNLIFAANGYNIIKTTRVSFTFELDNYYTNNCQRQNDLSICSNDFDVHITLDKRMLHRIYSYRVYNNAVNTFESYLGL